MTLLRTYSSNTSAKKQLHIILLFIDNSVAKIGFSARKADIN